MKTIVVVSLLCFLTLAGAGRCAAQPDEWTVITVAPDTFRSCVIGGVVGDSVSLIRPGETVRVAADSISLLIRKIDSRFWTGAGYGTLIGGTLGAIAGAAAHEESQAEFQLFRVSRTGDAFLGGILGGLGGFVVGGLIGAASGGEERLDLSERSPENKLTILRQLGQRNQ